MVNRCWVRWIIVSKFRWGGPWSPHWTLNGYPSIGDCLQVPSPEGNLTRSGWDISIGTGWGYPLRDWMELSPIWDWGYPLHQGLDVVWPLSGDRGSKASSCYTAGSMPLAFMQEDFLVGSCFHTMRQAKKALCLAMFVIFSHSRI